MTQPHSIADYLNKNNQAARAYAWFPTIVRVWSKKYHKYERELIWFEPYWVKKVYEHDGHNLFKSKYIKKL